MTLEQAIEQVGKEKDKAQTEAGAMAAPDREIYLWGLQDGFRRAIEIMSGKVTEAEQEAINRRLVKAGIPSETI